MLSFPAKGSSDVSLVLCGAAGQGVQTVEEILVESLKRAGFNVFASREYMSVVREATTPRRSGFHWSL